MRPILRLEVHLPPLHPGQQAVAASTARFRVVVAGRRWGKTRLAATVAVAEALQGRRCWWVAPTFPLATIGWRMLRSLARQVPGAEVRESERIIALPGGGFVQCKSADNPDSLRGEGLDLAVIDETAYVAAEAWTEALRPALADRRGRALFISTPGGLNWFHDLYQAAVRDTTGEWAAWHFRTADNPHIATEELEAARRSMPSRAYEQEIEARFLTNGGAVFPRELLDAALSDDVPPLFGR